MGGKRSYFRVGLTVSGLLFCALWLLLTVPFFFRLMERAGDGASGVIWAFTQAAYVGLVYALLIFWWITIPLLALPPFVGGMLDEREAIKAREQAEVKQ